VNFDIELNGKKHRISLHPEGEEYRVQLDGKPCSADAQIIQPNLLSLLVEGRSYRILFDPRPGSESSVVIGESRILYKLEDPRSLRSRGNTEANDSGARPISASMPGRIIRILVNVGELVEAQQGLIVVEAMKMQNELKAPRAGKVTRIATEVGAIVQAGNVLLVIE